MSEELVELGYKNLEVQIGSDKYKLVNDHFRRRTSLKVGISRNLIAIIPNNTETWKTCKQSLRQSQDNTRKVVNGLTSIQAHLDCFARTILRMSLRVKNAEQEGEEFSLDSLQSDQERLSETNKEFIEQLKKLDTLNNLLDDIVPTLRTAQDAMLAASKRDHSSNAFIERFSKTIQNINQTYSLAKVETDKLILAKVDLQTLIAEEKEVVGKMERIRNSNKPILTQIDKLEKDTLSTRTDYEIKIKEALKKRDQSIRLIEDELKEVEKVSDDHVRKLMYEASIYEATSLNKALETPMRGSVIRIYFVLDTSGSMSGDPWNKLVDSYNTFTSYRSSDLMTAILFNGESHLLKPEIFCPAHGTCVKLPDRCLGGSTSFFSAFSAVQNLLKPDEPSAIIFFTDGASNSRDDARKSVDEVKSMKKVNKSLRLFAIGLGSCVKMEDIEEIVKAGNNGTTKLPGEPPIPLIYMASNVNQLSVAFNNISMSVDRAMVMDDHTARAAFLDEQLTSIQDKTNSRIGRVKVTYRNKVNNLREGTMGSIAELEKEMENLNKKSHERISKLKLKLKEESDELEVLQEKLVEIQKKKEVCNKDIEDMVKKTDDFSDMVIKGNETIKQEFQNDIDQLVKSVEENKSNLVLVGAGISDANALQITNLLEAQTAIESIANMEINQLIVFGRSIAKDITAFESELNKLSKPSGKSVYLWEILYMKLIQDDCIQPNKLPVRKFLDVVSYLVGKELDAELEIALSGIYDGVSLVDMANDRRSIEDDEETLTEWLKTRIVQCSSGARLSESELSAHINTATRTLPVVKKDEEEDEDQDEEDLDENERKTLAKKKVQKNTKKFIRQYEEGEIRRMQDCLDEVKIKNKRLRNEVKITIRQASNQVKNLLYTTCDQKWILKAKDSISYAEGNIAKRCLMLMKIIEEYKHAVQEGFAQNSLVS